MSGPISRRYSGIVIAQYALLLLDISINSFASFARSYYAEQLVLYAIQDFCLIVALAFLLVGFFSTYIFQVGLIQLLYERFRMTLVICVSYVILGIGLHVWYATAYRSWPIGSSYWSHQGLRAFRSVHRIVAVFYYYLYKRATLKIADPRFYRGTTASRSA